MSALTRRRERDPLYGALLRVPVVSPSEQAAIAQLNETTRRVLARLRERAK